MSGLRRLSTPIKIGLAFGLLGLLLTGIGILRGNVPPQPASIAVALLISGGGWFLGQKQHGGNGGRYAGEGTATAPHPFTRSS